MHFQRNLTLAVPHDMSQCKVCGLFPLRGQIHYSGNGHGRQTEVFIASEKATGAQRCEAVKLLGLRVNSFHAPGDGGGEIHFLDGKAGRTKVLSEAKWRGRRKREFGWKVTWGPCFMVNDWVLLRELLF